MEWLCRIPPGFHRQERRVDFTIQSYLRNARPVGPRPGCSARGMPCPTSGRPEILHAKVGVFVELYRKTEEIRQLQRREFDQQLEAEKQHYEIRQLRDEAEEPDLVRSYDLGVNAYVVKPVDFNDFVGALNKLGLFWAVINQPPPGSVTRGS